MKALIDPRVTNITYISSWNEVTTTINGVSTTSWQPVFSTYPNSARVCQVEPDANIFPVADPLYWTACPDSATADQWYCDTSNNTVLEIVNAPEPV